MKKPAGLVGEIGEEVEKTVEAGKKEVTHSIGEAVEELLRSLFGTAKPLSAEKKQALEKNKEAEKRQVRAQVLEEFMPSPEEERVYYQKQKEEARKRAEKVKEVKKKAWEAGAASPKGKKQRGSLFESLRRKTSQAERKGGKF